MTHANNSELSNVVNMLPINSSIGKSIINKVSFPIYMINDVILEEFQQICSFL